MSGRAGMASRTTVAGSWVLYSGVPWNSPWLNDQQLAYALAADDRVLLVEPPRSPLSPGGERVLRPRLRRGDGGVHVLTILSLPKVGSARWQRASAPLVRAQVRWAVRRLGLAPVLAAVAMGPQARLYKGAAGERRFVGFVSDWLEAGSEFLHVERAVLAKASRRLWESADLLCVTSQPLEDALRSRGFDPCVVPHGFDDSLASVYDEAPAPEEYAAAGSPIMALAGRLNRRLDVELLDRLAARFSTGTLFMIGPLAPRDATPALARLLERRNVVHVPAKDRHTLPRYLRHADVLLVPYVADEWSLYSSPMKIWDYLYAGAPIVGHGCPPLLELGEPIAYHGDTHEAVLEALDRALSVADPAAVGARRRALAMQSTWRTRAARLRALVANPTAVARA